MHEAEGLRVDGLTVGLRGRDVVRNVSFAMGASEAYGLVGESGSGKSMTCRAILGLLPAGAVTSGQIRLGETSLLELSPRDLKSLRGSAVGMVFQDPTAALNPVLRVGRSIAQVIRSHGRVGRAEARTLAIAAMKRVGIRDAERRAQN
jgi:peptide/nickel transport system ATP-binding protein